MSAITDNEILVVDRTACAGHGLCYGAAPDLIDCDDQGDPIVPDRALTVEELRGARDAASLCPERALSIRTAGAPTEENRDSHDHS